MEAVLVGVAVLAAIGLGGVWAGLARLRRGLDARLAAADSELRRLADSGAWREHGAEEMRREVSAFRQALEHMRVRDDERRAREEQGWAVLHRVSAVLAGSVQTGRAGENVLRDALAHLPPSMLVRDFRVNGRVVEFGLVLPDGRRLPVDSKWPADRELQLLADCRDESERERLVRLVERTVTERAREVAGYRDPALTSPVAVAAVPDSAYAVLRRAHADAYRWGVIVIPYSMALPAVLFLHSVMARFGSAGDVEACLTDLGGVLDAFEMALENKVAKASTMLANATEELRGHMGKARVTLARARDSDGALEEVVVPRLAGVPH
jgi:RmuC family